MHHFGSSGKPRSRRTRRPSYKMLQENPESARRDSWKRRRDLLGRRSWKATRVEVVVPTLRQLNARLQENHPAAHTLVVRDHDSQGQRPSPRIKSEEREAKMHFLLQARVKAEVKPEDTTLENIAQHRLTSLGCNTLDIRVPRNILEVTTSRRVTSRIWGGNMRSTFPKIGKEFTHGLDDFMYTSLEFNPHAPRQPGFPGLIFVFKDKGQEWPKIMRLIVRLRRNTWQYMGQYKLTAAPPLTSVEWSTQPDEVKRMWANKLSETKLGGDLRAKIILRKRLGRDPTLQEVAISLQSKKNFYVTMNDILRACEEGQVIVRVWCMKCVGYDVDFQQRIAADS